MKKYISILVSAVLLAGCTEFGPVFTGEYDAPAADRIYTDEDLAGKECRTIAQVKALYVNGPVNITEDFYIKGQVTTSDRVGNFYREFYIQDETSGIAIKAGKSGLYNTYKQGQWIYVLCKGLTLGDYEGAKQLGLEDITGEYETAYIDIQMLIDRHVLKGAMAGPDEMIKPIVVTYNAEGSENDLFLSDNKTLNPEYVGKLVTVGGLKYANGIFCMAYVDPNQNHKLQSNRIFLDNPFSGFDGGPTNVGATLKDKTKLRANWSVDTWAMSKNQFAANLANGNFDAADIGNGPQKVRDKDPKDQRVYREKIGPSAYSVSQYFSLSGYGNKNKIAVRSSGYAKFSDTRLPDAVLGIRRTVNSDGTVTITNTTAATVTITGVMGVYDGEAQMTLIDLDGVMKDDGKTPWYNEDGTVNE
ncbi:MAG: hypothetical protein E7116_01005 [Bacteroidales bacterium]|nr:hypothetical protein [Bacteroidales bacterium]